MSLLKLVLLILYFHNFSSHGEQKLVHHCGHAHINDEYDDESMEKPRVYLNAPTPSRSKERNESVPFKALFIIHDEISQTYRENLSQILTAVNEKLGKVIKGPPLDEIRYDRCTGYTATIKCDIGCQQAVCGDLPIPEEFTMPCQNQDPTPSSKVAKWNKENYTLVAYVSMRGHHENLSSDCVSNILAYASDCQKDPNTHRYSHGIIYLCSLELFSPGAFELAVNTLIHELLHVVIYNLDSTRNRRLCPQGSRNCQNLTWTEVKRVWKLSNGTTTEEPAFLTITPAVVKAAKENFQCDDLEGAELHKEWDETKNRWVRAAEHWSRRLFPDELMNPIIDGNSKLSALTLGAIQDSGWYQVDVSLAEPLAIRPLVHGCDVAKRSSYDVIQQASLETDEKQWHVFPYCIPDKGPLCSVDGKVPLSCMEIPHIRAMIAQQQDDHIEQHPECDKKREVRPEDAPFGGRVGYGTMCITVTSFTNILEPTPLCFGYKCDHDKKMVVIYLNPPKSPTTTCEFVCPESHAYKITTHKFQGQCGSDFGKEISYFCPNMTEVCGRPNISSTSTSTSATVSLSPTAFLPLPTTSVLTSITSSASASTFATSTTQSSTIVASFSLSLWFCSSYGSP